MQGKLFYQLFRKRGFSETMNVLDSFENKEAVQKKFFKNLSDMGSYPNAFFRVKDELLEYDIIAYKLNEENKKTIYLTEKGSKIWDLITKIEEYLKNNLSKKD